MPENNIRSEAVIEIVSTDPGYLVRNGMSILIIFLICIVAISSYIKYPDVINTTAKLAALNAPKEIKTKISARLINLIPTENVNVKQGEILGYLESIANPAYIINLSTTIDSTVYKIQQGEIPNAINNLDSFVGNNRNDKINGELQPAYQTFLQIYYTYIQYLKDGFYLQKLNMLQQDITYLQSLKENLLLQKKMTEEDIKLMKENFAVQEKLSEQKVIAPVEYRNEKSKFISKEMLLPQINTNIINNDDAQHGKQKEIKELENQIAQQQNVFVQGLQSFKATIDDWKTKYLLIAPICGKVNFAGFIQVNQQLQVNQTICYINPNNSAYYFEILIPQYNMGKIKTGQKVHLKFSSYPYQQYGYVEGVLDFISNIPTDSGYLGKVLLPKGLLTNYNKPLQYRNGLLAQAEIITENIHLLDRFYYSLKI